MINENDNYAASSMDILKFSQRKSEIERKVIRYDMIHRGALNFDDESSSMKDLMTNHPINMQQKEIKKTKPPINET